MSVVIPAYNAGRFLREAVESVLSQTRPAEEVIVVDDGSEDDTASVAASFGDRVRYRRQANAGQASARNHGIRESTGDVVAFLDADDVWRRDKLEKQLALLERRPEVGLIYCSMVEIDAAGRRGPERPADYLGTAFREVLLGQGQGTGGSTPLVPRAVLESVGLFDETLSPCEDTDLLWRIAVRHEIDYVPEPLVYYRQHPANTHRNLVRMTRAWTLMYAKALRSPEVRRLGPLFRARCRGRLYSMLAGDYAVAGRTMPAIGYGLRAVAFWPPSIVPLTAGLARRLRRQARS